MDIQVLIENVTNPALLFFVLGVIAVQIKSDLEIPENSSKFISIYLLLSIGFKGGQELSHSGMNLEILSSIFLGLFLAITIPVSSFLILKRKMSVANAGAIAASYGSVSAVTFVTATSFLEFEAISFNGHMIAVMAIMEAPAIVMGVMLINYYKKDKKSNDKSGISKLLWHSVTNGSVILIFGSLIIGFTVSAEHAEGIKPFTTDIFKGFLAIFLLDMGITSGKQLSLLVSKGLSPFLFSSLMPFVNGLIALFISQQITDNPGNQLLFAILGASASYIAVPAAMKQIVPDANPSLYLPMALGITFPINVILGIPFYYTLIIM
ncbi:MULTISPECIES: sodium-dependent bicarbonate transport family permease [unclassified Flammeovirga]|uniref:sodium-dependent bicarbonate transport family permease n=1 Tax=unclassified Flammeovirga TaxID=2637820 RepID=UPI0005C63392|nr:MULTISPECIES: sodium-dependent bicarbonate transport family permease [unclassified Flammeovirga]MBD0403753.1 sodium-dependent bicarbonate transport family permease [Flammeovirga sp. EKP202]